MNKELYILPAFVKKSQKADEAFWMTSAVLLFLTLFLSLIDAATLFSVFDSVLYESEELAILVTLGIALMLNFIPLLLARFYHLFRYKISGIKLPMLIGLIVVFAILYIATFYLRWETRQLNFSGASATLTSSSGQTDLISTTNANSQEAIATTILLGISPLITSAVNLFLAYLSDDPVKLKINRLKYQRSVLESHLNRLTAASNELDRDWNSYLSSFDEARFKTIYDEITTGSDLIRALARQELAKKLGDPDSISTLLEPDEEAEEELS